MKDLFSISEICKTGSGGTPSRTRPDFYGGHIPWVKSGELRENIIFDTEEKITDVALENSSAKIVPAGSLLLAMYGATIGRLATLGIDATTNQAVCFLNPDPKKVFTKYLYYALLAKVPELIAKGNGGAQPNISQDIIKNTKVYLPPLPEQRRIAAILDKADSLRRKRAETLKLLNQFLRSVFLDMFGDPEVNPHDWSSYPLEEVITSTKLGLVRGAKEMGVSRPFAYIRMDAILGDGQLTLKQLRRVHATTTEVAEFSLENGDFLFNTRNSRELVGKTALFEGKGTFLFNNNIMRIRFANTIEPQYMIALFQTGFIKRQLETCKSGTTSVVAIYFKNLRNLKVLVPPLTLQKEFTARIAKIRILETNQFTNHQSLDDLFSSLTQRAFRGEL